MPTPLAGAGLDPGLAAAFSDAGWDRAIEASLLEAADLASAGAVYELKRDRMEGLQLPQA